MVKILLRVNIAGEIFFRVQYKINVLLSDFYPSKVNPMYRCPEN